MVVFLIYSQSKKAKVRGEGCHAKIAQKHDGQEGLTVLNRELGTDETGTRAEIKFDHVPCQCRNTDPAEHADPGSGLY